MRFSLTYSHNMIYLPTLGFQIIRYHRPMTTPPNSFGTHIGSSFFFSYSYELSNTFFKIRSLHIIGISSERLVMPTSVLRVFMYFTSST